MEKAEAMGRLAAQALGIDENDVIVASTGVIGQALPIEPIEKGVEALKGILSKDGGTNAAEAIMTTDTVKKEWAVQLELGGKTVTIGGIAKGSGMIHINMGTTLSFVTTDAAISAEMLRSALTEAADGEGATKLIIAKVSGAKDESSAKTIAKSVICSSLVKAAMFGADANCGRILCAIGYSGAQTDVKKIDVSYQSAKGGILVCQNGCGLAFDEDKAKEILLENEITIVIKLGDGTAAAEAYGCDLTYDYVKINGDYRT